jgi:CO/xanthine dehydrogenase FAD-binding subunit
VFEAERILVGAQPLNDVLRAAAAEAKKISDPVEDTRGDVEFKREMAAVLVHRGLVATLQRLQGGNSR